MTNALRNWTAGLALALSAMILTASSDPWALGRTSLLALVILFTHGWIVAVAERVGSSRGGIEIRRFPIGPRLLQPRRSLFYQFLVPVALLALVTRDPIVSGVALLVVLVLSADILRSALPYLLPAGFVVWGLLSMNEFHTLSDLLVTGKSWLESLVKFALWAVILGGSLLRTDVGAPLPPKGRLVALLAGLPGYLVAFWLFSRTSLAGLQPDLLALSLVLLAGGVFQSMVVGLLAKSADLGERLPQDIPLVQAHDIGLAMMPLALVIVAAASLGFVPIGPSAASLATPAAWAGLLAITLIVPAVLGAALVGDALDRVDGRRRGRKHCAVVLAAFAAWFVLGPHAFSAVYSPGGAVEVLRASFPSPLEGWDAVATSTERASLTGAYLGGDFALWGLPATDLMRSVTLMVLAAAGLSARLLRHARKSLRGPGWGTVVLATVLQALGLWLLMPRLGPLGAGLATALSCGVMLIVDMLTGIVVLEEQEQAAEYEGVHDIDPDAPLDDERFESGERPDLDVVPSIDLGDAEPSLADILGPEPSSFPSQDEDADSPTPISL